MNLSRNRRQKKINLKGKAVNILGDSITEGVGASETRFRYTDVFAKITGAKVNNYGISGTRIVRKRVPTAGNPSYDLDFMSGALEMDENADAVVVFGGTNDFGHGDAEMGDMNSRSPYTFYGACHILMESLAKTYCGKPIVFMTPLKRSGNDLPYSLGHTRSEYVDIIKEVTKYYSVAILDLYTMSGICPYIPEVMHELMPDGLHPSDKGHQIVAERLKGFMESL